MRYLIDTCIFTTYVTDIESLSRDALAIIEDYDNNMNKGLISGMRSALLRKKRVN